MSHAVGQHVSTITFRIINCNFSVDEIHESRRENFFLNLICPKLHVLFIYLAKNFETR
jgi:hypothetical protein